MRLETRKIYEIDELSEEAKENALEHWRNTNTEIFWENETLESLKGLFCNCAGVYLEDYYLGEYNSWIKVSFNQDGVEELSGKRAIAWIENNLLYNIRIRYGIHSKYKDYIRYGKYYRAGMIEPCPFTGYYADDDFLYSLIDDIKKGSTLLEAFEGLASKYQSIINSEIEFQNSMEYFVDHAQANDYEFDLEGNLI